MNDKVNSPGYWTKAKCAQEAKKYRTKSDFARNSPKAYSAARKKEWWSEICAHMKSPQKPHGYWTKERCKLEALKYSSRNDFRESSAGSAASRRGWMDECCEHMHSSQKKRGHWTKETCAKEAKKYNTRAEFRKKAAGARFKAQQEGWMDEICSHMNRSQNPKGYWNKEKCISVAKRYKTIKEFRQNNSKAYNAAIKNNWIAEIKPLFKELQKPSGYWTKEKCKEEATKYKQRVDFQKKSSSAYVTARNKGWLEYCCSHMLEINKKVGYWSKKRCLEEASRFINRSDFVKGAPVAYQKAHRMGWLDDICKHMKPQGSHFKRYIYAIKFQDNSVYIGLTYNLNTRKASHINKSSNPNVKQKINQGVLYEFKSDEVLYHKDEAGKKEEELISEYENNGWEILNVVKAGNLGSGKLFWTKERCKESALTYLSRDEFRRKAKGAYESARRRGWLDELCSHMQSDIKDSGYWTEERILEVAYKCLTKSEFNKRYSGAFGAARRLGIFEKACSHMTSPKMSNGYWIKERCEAEAKKYQTLKEFRKNSSGAYLSARRNDWIKDICKHMKIALKK